MKIINTACIAIGLMAAFGTSNAQTSFNSEFNNIEGWSTNSPTLYEFANTAGTLQINSGAGITYQTVDLTFTTIDVSNSPLIQVDIKSASPVVIRIDFLDNLGRTTNTTDTRVSVPGNNTFATYIFNLTGKFSQTYPSDTANGRIPYVVNSKTITKISVFVNPSNTASKTSQMVFFDNLKIGSTVVVPPPPSGIRVNQIGYYPVAPKVGVLAQIKADKYFVVSTAGDTVYRGIVPAPVKYEASNEMVSKVDFSSVEGEGTYTLNADTFKSAVFKIQPKVHMGVAKGLIKSFYYNRASMTIVDPMWPRTYNPDEDFETVVKVHSSANSTVAPTGTEFSSTKGWFDAGDYNKYVVNAGISTYIMQSLYEHYPLFFDTLNTKIPESNNGLADILDEAIWELEWLLTTQAKDGSVYHKITELEFSSLNGMPGDNFNERYAVGRSTAAACNFAAVMAQAARIFADPAKKSKLPYPAFGDTCLARAKKAWTWIEQNPDRLFSGNPAGVATGTYQDNNVGDEISWARTELFITTKDKAAYFDATDGTANSYSVPGYNNVSTLALISLVNYRAQLAGALGLNASDTSIYKAKLLTLANNIKNNLSAYGTPFGSSMNHFNWGGTANAGNQGMILLQAFRLTGDDSYVRAALANLDYILGRNATGYSFVTGFGTKTPMKPHHRISLARPTKPPVPGMLVGGPNRSPDGANESLATTYPSDPARSYLDDKGSHSTNEPAINYTAGGMYLANGIEALIAGYGIAPLSVEADNDVTSFSVKLYPNPSREVVSVEFENIGRTKISVTDIKGIVLIEKVAGNSNKETFSIANLESGIYFVSVSNDAGTSTQKLIKN